MRISDCGMRNGKAKGRGFRMRISECGMVKQRAEGFECGSRIVDCGLKKLLGKDQRKENNYHGTTRKFTEKLELIKMESKLKL